jgi:hypothetical protein
MLSELHGNVELETLLSVKTIAHSTLEEGGGAAACTK